MKQSAQFGNDLALLTNDYIEEGMDVEDAINIQLASAYILFDMTAIGIFGRDAPKMCELFADVAHITAHEVEGNEAALASMSDEAIDGLMEDIDAMIDAEEDI